MNYLLCRTWDRNLSSLLLYATIQFTQYHLLKKYSLLHVLHTDPSWRFYFLIPEGISLYSSTTVFFQGYFQSSMQEAWWLPMIFDHQSWRFNASVLRIWCAQYLQWWWLIKTTWTLKCQGLSGLCLWSWWPQDHTLPFMGASTSVPG